MRILDENLLAGLARKPEAVAAFPFLRGAMRTVEEVCCGGSVRRRTIPDYAQMKQAVASLSPDQAERLLALAGIQAVRVVWRDGAKVQDRVLRRQVK